MLTTLFADLNAYYASVEQQLQPELRGRPVAVAPVLTPTSCCIAASYEAKAYGIKTAMLLGEARRRCPELVVVPSRPREYIRVHHEILAAVETCAPVHAVYSIDEFTVRLSAQERTPEAAVALARRIKRAIGTRVGEALRCSIGIAPNRLLAKIASDMEKPDGLIVLRREDLPHALHGLELTDLPGIANAMARRLAARGITTVEELCRRSEDELGRAWGSVVGRSWWRWLRGEETWEPPTERRSIGHQRVLPPQQRNENDAWAVAVRLLHRAAARARRLGYRPGRMTLSVGILRGGEWDGRVGLNGSLDTLTLAQALRGLWARRPRGTPATVGVTLHELTHERCSTLPLFPEERRREALARAIDRLDERHGRLTVYLGSIHGVRAQRIGGIAFGSIPDLSMPDAVD